MKKIVVLFFISNVTFLLNSSNARHFDCAVQMSHLSRMLATLQISEDKQFSLLQRLETESSDIKKSINEIVTTVSLEYSDIDFTDSLKAACRVHVASQRIKLDHVVK